MSAPDGAISTTSDLAFLLKQLLEEAAGESPPTEPAIADVVAAHLGSPLENLQSTTLNFDAAEHPSLQRALELLMTRGTIAATLIGVAADNKSSNGVTFADILSKRGRLLRPGPVDYVTLPTGLGQASLCVQLGVGLAHIGEERFAFLLRGPVERPNSRLAIDLLTKSEGTTSQVTQTFRTALVEANVHRGHVLAFDSGLYGGDYLTFRERPAIARDDLVLPQSSLDALERFVTRSPDQAADLRRFGQRLRRGLLLGGPPGTGKTLTAQYVCSLLAEHTVILLAANSLRAFGQAAALARRLEPAVVVIEDIDSIALERTTSSTAPSPVLFQLLNELDGQSGDADVLFLMTSNRPEELERALIDRPGRVDMAIEYGLPGVEERARLLDVFLGSVSHDREYIVEVVAATDGCTPAFIREVVRRAISLSVCGGESGATVVTAEDFRCALEQMQQFRFTGDTAVSARQRSTMSESHGESACRECR